MDLFLNTLFIKKYIFLSTFFNPSFFFNTSKRGWDTPPPQVRTRRICWAVPQDQRGKR